MSVTLNGIAQGYITDRVVDLLRAGGIEHSVVDMGEVRVLDDRPDSGPWTVGLADPQQPERVVRSIGVIDQAVATSAGAALEFDAAGRFNHIFDPRTGTSARLHRMVTVIASSATAADALSTAFSLTPAPLAEHMARRLQRGTPPGVLFG